MEEGKGTPSLKLSGDQALRASDFQTAFDLYSRALVDCPDDFAVLCNRSLVALKLGSYEQAEKDADIILNKFSSSDLVCPSIAAVAYHRKAQAQLGQGRLVPALKTYKTGLKACKDTINSMDNSISAAARLALDEAPLKWLAMYWSRMVNFAQQPHPLSSRDGKLLKLVPKQQRLDKEGIQSLLENFLAKESFWQDEARFLIWKLWAQDKRPERAYIALFRSMAYLQANIPEQSQRDALTAIAHGPPDWPAPLILASSSFEAQGENVQALIHLSHAIDALDKTKNEQQEELEHAFIHDSLDRLLRRVPEHYAEAVRNGGYTSLQTLLQIEKERSLPPFMRPKPKYYYYYEWMKRRILERHPSLPEPVMDRLLTMDANELDLLLQYPIATDRTVKYLEGILEEQGQHVLASSPIPLLTWEQKKEYDEVPLHEISSPLQMLDGSTITNSTITSRQES